MRACLASVQNILSAVLLVALKRVPDPNQENHRYIFLGGSHARLRLAEVIEEIVEEHGEDSVDQAGDAEAHGEYRLRLREQ